MPIRILVLEAAVYVALGLVVWRAVAAKGALWHAQRAAVPTAMAVALLLEMWNERVVLAARYPISLAVIPGTGIPLAVLCFAGLFAAGTLALAATAARRIGSTGALRWVVFAVVVLGAVFQAHTIEAVFQAIGYWEILPRFRAITGLDDDGGVAVAYVGGVCAFYAAFLVPACLAGLACRKGIALPLEGPSGTAPGAAVETARGPGRGACARARGLVVRYLRALRSGEVVLMSGFAVAGLVFGVDAPGCALLARAAIFLSSILMLFSSIYVFNAWADRDRDRHNARLDALAQISGRSQLVLMGFFGGFALSLLSVLGWQQALAGTVSLALWLAYSWPRIGLKGVPFAGTAVHFVTQTLHFLMGYSVAAEPGTEAVALAMFFALLFSAGHLVHEAIDHEADKVAGFRTASAVFGRRTAVGVSLALFCVAGGYWTALWSDGTVVVAEWLPFALAFLVQGVGVLFLLRCGLRRTSLLDFRTLYRIGYLVAGITVMVGRWLF
jgi:4-hydroxybenzoate polyprenyltransferase